MKTSLDIQQRALRSVAEICEARLEMIALARDEQIEWIEAISIIDQFDVAAHALIDAIGSPDGWAFRHGC